MIYLKWSYGIQFGTRRLPDV